jgi:hypothetical protein
MADPTKPDPAVTRVRIEYEDGSWRELNGVDVCKKWSDMVGSQASMAFVHGMKYDPLPWEGPAAARDTP